MKALKKQLAFCLAVVMLMSLLPGAISAAIITTKLDGNVEIRNNDHSDQAHLERQMNKTLSYDSATGQYYLELSVGGFSYTELEAIQPEPLYTVLVLDATSSMNETDGGDSSFKLWTNVSAAAKAYISALFDNANGRDIYIAIVSFGYGARVHTLGLSNMTHDAAVGDRTIKSPDSNLTPLAGEDAYIGAWRGGDLSLYAAGDGISDASVTQDASLPLGKYIGYKQKDFYFDNSGNADAQSATVDKLNTLIDNITQYSGTNVESGLLLAEDLLAAAPAKAKKTIVLMTDGESAASSTFAALFRDDLDGVNLANVYTMSCDSNYIQDVYDTVEGHVNPFDGNWHNADVATSIATRIIPFSSGASAMLAKAKGLAAISGDLIASAYLDTLPTAKEGLYDDYTEAEKFLETVHKMLADQGAVNNDTQKYIKSPPHVTHADADFWNDAVRSLFWQAEELTYEGTPGKTIYPQNIGEAMSGMPVPPNKPMETQLLDYI